MLSGGIAMLAGLGARKVVGQVPPPGPGPGPGGRGNFDMGQIQKMMLDNLRELFEIKDDGEWKLIADRVTKVFETRTLVGTGGGAGMARLFRRPGQEGPDGGRRPGMFGPPDPDADALQHVIDAKGSNAELKAAIDKFVEARKQKQTRLEQAQAALREVLTVRQEAVAISVGLL